MVNLLRYFCYEHDTVVDNAEKLLGRDPLSSVPSGAYLRPQVAEETFSRILMQVWGQVKTIDDATSVLEALNASARLTRGKYLLGKF
ncbi:hypothetical protein LZ554_003188 [Drepanopeziza brunnea f. sp. 'monogermtubi']|nr:hypothetical protein LZ554_003188 [Drepanopeziza brunnea f. sp. 'monogermtubi']